MYAAGARLMAVPGCPLPTFCTASAANTRTVSTARRSTSVHSRRFSLTCSLLICLYPVCLCPVGLCPVGLCPMGLYLVCLYPVLLIDRGGNALGGAVCPTVRACSRWG